MNPPTPAAPRTWNLTGYFPEFDGQVYRTFKQSLRQEIAARLSDAASTPPLAPENMVTWAAVFLAWEDLGARLAHLTSYLDCLSSADAASEAVQRERTELATLAAEHAKLKSQLLGGLRAGPPPAWLAFLGQPALAGATHAL